jgi:SOS-response transcriptional repressor LexA
MHDGPVSTGIPTVTLDLPGFCVEVRDESMAGAGLHDGDLVWVEPRRAAVPREMVLARIRVGRRWLLRVRRLVTVPETGRAFLAANDRQGSVLVASNAFAVIGPVTSAVCALPRRMLVAAPLAAIAVSENPTTSL